MHQGYQGVAKHLFLAKRQKEEIFPSLVRLVIKGLVLTQKDIAADLSDLSAEPPDGETRCQDKQYLLEHIVSYFEFCILNFELWERSEQF